jgi:hypothetical protein
MAGEELVRGLFVTCASAFEELERRFRLRPIVLHPDLTSFRKGCGMLARNAAVVRIVRYPPFQSLRSNLDVMAPLIVLFCVLSLSVGCEDGSRWRLQVQAERLRRRLNRLRR